MGLTGGIGAGKSTVARRLAGLGAVLVDSDAVAREVVAPGTDGLAAVVAEFGDGVLAADGSLDRPALAAVAFADDESRRRLNAVLHPRIGARTAELVAAAPNGAVVVQDVPLLVEGGMAPWFPLVVVVHAEPEERVRRLVEVRGMTAEDARARLRAQAGDEQRRAVADVWLDNSGAPEDLGPVVDALWRERLVPYEETLRGVRGLPALPTAVVAADPTWPAQARRLVARVAAVAGERAARVDHVGPTAVPGMAGVDVLAVSVAVHRADDVAPVRDGLAGAGLLPGPDGVLRSGDPARAAVVAVSVAGHGEHEDALLWRDWLSADPVALQAWRAGPDPAWRAPARAWAASTGWDAAGAG
ncbi:dephospho-CoA kinase [Rhodococcus aerolatus]